MAAAAGFQLPAWAMLSAEQESIVNLPTNKDYMIQGSPGTGKTVMALYRAARISQRDQKDVTILVYNRPLMLYMSTAIKGNSMFNRVKINTFHSWLNEFYRNTFGVSAPKLGPYEPDWPQVARDSARVPNRLGHVIIDEAQDFPIELIRALKTIATNITCFIDPNQAIEADKTQVTDALKGLCIECPKTLRTNYRNTKTIASLSKIYWNGKGFFADANVDGAGSTKPTMIRCRDYDDQTAQMCRIIMDNRGLNIGVLVNNKSLNVTYNTLKDKIGNSVNVQMYKSQAKTGDLNFDKKGVKVFSFGTMKGLEFDLVLVTRFEKMKSTGDENADINRAYVAITRACKNLNIFYFGEKCTAGWANVMPPLLVNRSLCNWK